MLISYFTSWQATCESYQDAKFINFFTEGWETWDGASEPLTTLWHELEPGLNLSPGLHILQSLEDLKSGCSLPSMIILKWFSKERVGKYLWWYCRSFLKKTHSPVRQLAQTRNFIEILTIFFNCCSWQTCFLALECLFLIIEVKKYYYPSISP